MLSFTLDTNCLIDLAYDRPGAEAVKALANLHRSGQVDVAIVAISASERQQDHRYLTNYAQFREWMMELDLADLRVLLPMGYNDVTFFDACVFTDESMVAREREIHNAMFPAAAFSWPELAAKEGFDPMDLSHPTHKRWRNRFCDRQMYWAHDHHGRRVFVSSNVHDFGRLVGHPKFPHALVLAPDAALAAAR